MFAKSPGFTAICILSIAFGTGANVAMFSVADALLLRPLPVPRPDELLVVGARTVRSIQTVTAASYPDYVDIRDQSRSFDGVLAYMWQRAGIAIDPAAPPQVRIITLVSGNFTDVLRIRPVLGRAFRPDEDVVPKRDAVALLSYALWKQQYQGDESALGRKVRIDGVDFTIVGVLPDGFTGLETRGLAESVYIPLAMAPALGDPGLRRLLTSREMRILTARGRLKPDVSITEARAELATIGANLARAHPATNRNQGLIAQTELESRLSADYLDAGLVLLLSIMSTAVLCVACANVGGLLVSRAPLRAREMALRLAVGAGRGRLVRQLITESLMISIAGGLCGIAVGHAGIAVLGQIEYPTDMIQPPAMEIDQRALMFSVLVATLSAFVFGMGPALQTTRVNLTDAMRAGEIGTPRRGRLTGRSSLVAVQVALSLMLVTLAVFTMRVFQRVFGEGPGFRTTQIAKITVDTVHRGYDDASAVRFFERLVDETRWLPGVESAALITRMPFWGVELISVVPEGRDAPEGRRITDGLEGPATVAAAVDEQYFATMGIGLVAGRAFAETDRGDSRPVAIVNETFARRYWPGEDAIGRRFRSAGGPWIEIVGIARDAKYIYFVEPQQEAVYFAYRQRPRGSMALLAKTAGESHPLVAPLREVVRGLDAEMPAYDAQTIETFYAVRATGFANVAMEMIGGLGSMGMILTMVGLYGLVSYSVSRRTREIGIRIAIGATYGHVLRMILRQGLRPAWFGVAVGVVLSAGTMRILPWVFPTAIHYDVRTFAIVIPLLLVIAFLAAFLPARRAARVNPTVALRYE